MMELSAVDSDVFTVNVAGSNIEGFTPTTEAFALRYRFDRSSGPMIKSNGAPPDRVVKVIVPPDKEATQWVIGAPAGENAPPAAILIVVPAAEPSEADVAPPSENEKSLISWTLRKTDCFSARIG